MRVEYREYLFMVQLVVTGPEPVWEWEVYRKLSGHIVAHGRAGSANDAGDAARHCIDLQSAAGRRTADAVARLASF
jgi:hypothetical protein